jgi:hypothetical protein
MAHEVVSPSDLEAEHLLSVLPLQPDLVPQPRTQVDGFSERGVFHVERRSVGLGEKDELEVVGNGMR